MPVSALLYELNATFELWSELSVKTQVCFVQKISRSNKIIQTFIFLSSPVIKKNSKKNIQHFFYNFLANTYQHNSSIIVFFLIKTKSPLSCHHCNSHCRLFQIKFKIVWVRLSLELVLLSTRTFEQSNLQEMCRKFHKINQLQKNLLKFLDFFKLQFLSKFIDYSNFSLVHIFWQLFKITFSRIEFESCWACFHHLE